VYPEKLFHTKIKKYWVMDKIEIFLEIKQVRSVRELQVLEGGEYVRKIGQVYFQYMPDGKYLTRVITERTNGEWIVKMINQKAIYVPTENIKAEQG
jgi:hypothetical protein